MSKSFMNIEIKLDSFEFGTECCGIMYLDFDGKYYPQKDWECFPVRTISELLEGVLKLWYKQSESVAADFLGSQMCDSEFPLDVVISRYEKGNDWKVTTGVWDFDNAKMHTELFSENISTRSLVKELLVAAHKIFEHCKYTSQSSFVTELEVLIKKVENL